MRILHPKTVELVATADDSVFKNATVSRKQIISHAWSEVFKYYSTVRNHPKMFISNKKHIGYYLYGIFAIGTKIGCQLDKEKIRQLDDEIERTFFNKYNYYLSVLKHHGGFDFRLDDYFDSTYLFSDLISLYYKGVNLLPMAFGKEWRKYIPVESRKEIIRQCEKTLKKENK